MTIEQHGQKFKSLTINNNVQILILKHNIKHLFPWIRIFISLCYTNGHEVNNQHTLCNISRYTLICVVFIVTPVCFLVGKNKLLWKLKKINNTDHFKKSSGAKALRFRNSTNGLKPFYSQSELPLQFSGKNMYDKGTIFDK